MPVGLEVYNSAGVLQIGQTLSNYTVVAKGTLTFSSALVRTPTAGPNIRAASVSLANAIAPLIAFRSTTTTGAGFWYLTQSGSTWTWWIAGLNGETCEYWIFDRAPASAVNNFGLEVFSATGTPIYRTEAAPLAIIDTAVWEITELQKLYPLGRKYGNIQLSPAGGRVVNNIFDNVLIGWDWGSLYWEPTPAPGGEVLKYSGAYWSTSQTPGWPFHTNAALLSFAPRPPSYVVDVTGL